MSIFKKQKSSHLKKALTFKDLFILCLAASIGGGIMTQVGEEIHQYTGAGIVISYLLAGIGCMLVALPYCELASMIPSSGGLYSYGYYAFGRFFAWIMLSFVIGELTTSCAAVSISCAEYTKELLPNSITNQYFQSIFVIFIIILCTRVLSQTINQYKNINTILVLSKFIVLILFLIFSISDISYENIILHEEHKWNGVFKSVSILYFSFTGFTSVATASQEAKNASRDLPLAILGSIAISTVIYMIISFVIATSLHYSVLTSNASLAFSLSFRGYHIIAFIVAIGSVLSMISVIFACLYASSRVIFIVASDKLLPEYFIKLNSNNVPERALWFSAILVMLSQLFSFNKLIEISSLCAIFTYLFGCLLAMYFRIYYAEEPRPFKAPFLFSLSFLAIFYLLYFFAINAVLSENIFVFYQYIVAFLLIYLIMLLYN